MSLSFTLVENCEDSASSPATSLTPNALLVSSVLSPRLPELREEDSMPDFVEVASTEYVISGTGAWVKPADTAVALFNVGGRIFAVADVCIRCASSLAAGALHATLIRCPRCGWQYDVTNGCVEGVPALRIQTFETKIVDAAILIATTATRTF